MQLLYVLLLGWARHRARAPIAVTGGPMADRSRPAALEKGAFQNGGSLHDAEKVDGVATGVAIPNGSARFPTVTANRAPGSDGYPVSGFCQATEWSDGGNLLNGPCPPGAVAAARTGPV